MLGLAVVGCVLLVVALGDSDPVAVAESEVDGADALDAAATPPQQPPTAAAELVATVEVAPEPEPPTWHEEQVRSGDNLSLIFARAGFTDRDVYEVSRSDGGRGLRKIYPGQTIAFLMDGEGRLDRVRHTE